MIIPKEIIEKAIEGGFNDANDNDFILDFAKYHNTYEPILMMPLFWQALGKSLNFGACVWCDGSGFAINEDICYRCKGKGRTDDESRKIAHRFFELILTNGDTEKFWQEILSNNKE